MEFHPVPAADRSASSSPTDAAAVAGAPGADKFWLRHPGTPNRSAQKLRRLTKEQVEQFDKDGFIALKAQDVWTPAELELLLASVRQLEKLPDQKGAWMKYYEPDRRDPTAPKLLCRMENFAQYNPGLDFIMRGDKLPAMCEDLFGEPAVMYKEKVNFKLPGADGFTPHQDVAAGWWLYSQSLHISCLVSIDPATIANGCLEVVPGRHKDGMLSPEWKELSPETVSTMKFEYVPTQPGDVLFFDSYVPHRSAPNNTSDSRRVLYVTYAKAAEGDHRARYYADKRAAYPPDIEREPGKKYEYKV